MAETTTGKVPPEQAYNADKVQKEIAQIVDGYLGPDTGSLELEEMLFAREAELKDLKTLTEQRGTPIPALFNQFYKFIQNPSSISPETMKRMIDTDDTLGSGIDFLVMCLMARLGRYEHKNEKITTRVNKVLEQVQGGFEQVLMHVLSATWAGFSVCEKVWGRIEVDGEETWAPVKIVPLPATTVLFETERTGEISSDGVLQYQRNYNPMLLSQGIGFFGGVVGGFGFIGSPTRPDVFAKFGDLPFPLRTANAYSYLSLRIPKAKCIHFSMPLQGNYDNPYGRSLLRRAYKWYIIADEVTRMMTTALDRKGTPLTVIYCDPSTTVIDGDKWDRKTDPRGNATLGISATAAARKAFEKVHNDSVVTLPGKKGDVFDVQPVQQSAATQDFIAALEYCDKKKMRALLLPTLIFGSGDGSGSWSLGQEHAKTFDKILDSLLNPLKNVLINQLVRDIIILNFPEEMWKQDGFGDFNKRELSQDEIQKEMEVIEKGINTGVIDQTDLEDLNTARDKIGWKPRTTTIVKPGGLFGGMTDDGTGIEPGADNGATGTEEPKPPGMDGAPEGKTPGKGTEQRPGQQQAPQKKEAPKAPEAEPQKKPKVAARRSLMARLLARLGIQDAETKLKFSPDFTQEQYQQYVLEKSDHIPDSGFAMGSVWDFVWSYTKDYPLDNLTPIKGTAEDWKDWFTGEMLEWKHDHGDEREGHFEKWAKKPEKKPPIVIEGTEGKLHVWDGHHRIAMAHIEDMKSIPIIYGKRKAAGGGK